MKEKLGGHSVLLKLYYVIFFSSFCAETVFFWRNTAHTDSALDIMNLFFSEVEVSVC